MKTITQINKEIKIIKETIEAHERTISGLEEGEGVEGTLRYLTLRANYLDIIGKKFKEIKILEEEKRIVRMENAIKKLEKMVKDETK